ncbi:NUDIX domain-containing protein [Streptomyces netropsis]|uniref:NUDIX domain-containing protein n=1 Tax=Streptomyces netropsis TaxID=55404 RepID=UPI0037B65F2D
MHRDHDSHSPRRRASALIRDDSGRVLTVCHTKHDRYWLPGGYVRPRETPRNAVEYEVRRLTGHTMKPRGLLVLEHRYVEGEKPTTEFVYAVRPVPTGIKIVLPEPDGRRPEILAYRWLTLDEAVEVCVLDAHMRLLKEPRVRQASIGSHCSALLALQIRAAVQAEATGTFIELTNGLPEGHAEPRQQPPVEDEADGMPDQVALRPPARTDADRPWTTPPPRPAMAAGTGPVVAGPAPLPTCAEAEQR